VSKEDLHVEIMASRAFWMVESMSEAWDRVKLGVNCDWAPVKADSRGCCWVELESQTAASCFPLTVFLFDLWLYEQRSCTSPELSKHAYCFLLWFQLLRKSTVCRSCCCVENVRNSKLNPRRTHPCSTSAHVAFSAR